MTKFDMSKIDVKKFAKWAPVAIAALMAGVQAVGEQREQARIDDMESRINQLEHKGEA